jgi:hypothetical protein
LAKTITGKDQTSCERMPLARSDVRTGFLGRTLERRWQLAIKDGTTKTGPVYYRCQICVDDYASLGEETR